MITLLDGLVRVGYERSRSEAREWSKLAGGAEKLAGEALRRIRGRAGGAIRKGVKERYTYHGALPIRSSVRGSTLELRVEGRREPLKKFRVRGGRRRERLYVQLVKGQGGVLERGFRGQKSGQYWRRQTESRLPILKLYGPSVAEMAGHEATPAEEINRRLEEMVESAMGAMM